MDADQAAQVLQRLQPCLGASSNVTAECAERRKARVGRSSEPDCTATKRSSKTAGQLSEDITSAEISADVLSNESTTPRKQSRSVKLYFVFDHVVHYQSLGSHRQCSAWLADALSSVFPKNDAKLFVMMEEVLAFPLDANDVVNSLETMELKNHGIREIRKHRDSGVLQSRHRDSPSSLDL